MEVLNDSLIFSVRMLFAFATAVFFSACLTPLLTKLALAYKFVDQPDFNNEVVTLGTQQRRVHLHPTPRVGGVGIVLAFLLSLLIWMQQAGLTGIIAPSLIIFFLGLVDDLKSISSKIRLCIQTLAAVLTVYGAGLEITQLALTPHLSFTLPFTLGFMLSVFIIVGAINSINMVDGLDGLAGGVTLISITLLSYIYFISTNNTSFLLVFSLPLVGAILGFLRYNTHPASIFMGDSGSNWLGFMMGIFLIFTVEGIGLMPSSMGSYAIARLEHTQPVMFISTLLCLSVPIFDSASVIFHRWFRGLSPMAPDKRHLHHSMLKLGLSHSQSVIAVYFVNLVVGIMGVIPIAFERYPLDWLPYLSMFIFLTILYFSVSMEDLSIKAIFGRNPLIKKTIESGAGAQMFLNTWETVNRYTIYVILVATPLFAGVAPATIGLAAIATTPLLILSIVLKNTNTDFLQCVFLAISTTIVLMANNANRIWVVFSGTGYSLQSFYNVAFVWLACSSLAFIIFTFRRRYLVFNPSDFLMVALPLLLTLVPEPFNNEYRLNIIALRALIMFMAIKSLAKRRHKVSYRLSFILLISCLYVFLTSVLNMRIVYT